MKESCNESTQRPHPISLHSATQFRKKEVALSSRVLRSTWQGSLGR